MSALGKLEKLLYRGLLRKARALDARPELRGYVFDVAVDHHPDVGWRRTGEPSRLVQAVKEGSGFAAAVKAAFRKTGEAGGDGLNALFKQQHLLNAFVDLAEHLPAPPLLPPPPTAPLLRCDVTEETKSFVLVTHPLAFFSESLNNQSVALMMADGAGQFRGFTLNCRFGTVGEMVSELQLSPPPKSLDALNACEVRVGGYMKEPGTLTLVGMHCYPDIPESAELLPGAYLTLLDTLSEVVQHEHHPAEPGDITVYMAHQEFKLDFIQGLVRHGHAVACAVPSSFAALHDLIHPPPILDPPGGWPDPLAREERHRIIKHVEYQRACLGIGGPVAEWASVPRRDRLPETLLEEYMRKVAFM